MTRADVFIWARRICAARSADSHVMLEISPEASLEDAQKAFHAIARMAHPDLHRTTATPEELDLVTNAFSLVASAYQTFRAQRLATTKMVAIKYPARTDRFEQPLKQRTFENNPAAPTLGPTAAELVPEQRVLTPATQMTARAMTQYRKAEQSLRRGDLPAAALHLKMAIATDPHSTFLRTALKEVEAELGKK